MQNLARKSYWKKFALSVRLNRLALGDND
jgi:hypothetical protein